MGFQLCTIANDSGLMAMAAKAAVNGFRKEVGADRRQVAGLIRTLARPLLLRRKINRRRKR